MGRERWDFCECVLTIKFCLVDFLVRSGFDRFFFTTKKRHNLSGFRFC